MILTEKEAGNISIGVGVYAMHHMHKSKEGTLICIKHKATSDNGEAMFGIEYVGDGYGGGSSYSWPAVEFRPITKPILIATAQFHKAMCEQSRAKQDITRLQREMDIWRGVIDVLKGGLAGRPEEA